MNGAELKSEIEHDLRENVLPFWMTYTPDPEYGGFYGALTNERHIRNDAPRSAVLYARILWTFSTAYRLFHDPAYLATAQRAYDYLNQYFWDVEQGGVYWAVNAQGQAIEPRKHSYAQAFMIYGLSEYHRATGDPASLQRAQQLFHLLEAHAFDPQHGGYLEGCARDWSALADMRLSPLEPNCHKSMNTLLHLMEAYTNLLRVWDDPALRRQQRALIQAFLNHVIHASTHTFQLFFEADWRVLTEQAHVSPGHDIEGSWLLVEAAEVSGEAELLAQCQAVAVLMAQAVYDKGRDAAGAVIYSYDNQHRDEMRHWWVQAEGVVGLYNAYQLSHQPHFAEAATQVWRIIATQFIDREHGEWFKLVQPDGTPKRAHVKIGPWECPYHNSRLGFEMLHRLV